ncbi:serum response factor homolog A-like [Ixodes scapularis]|uniref:serum response factor homolog A-like n=1 Tax=Ixodes scapularis TaxID=6945 RepID=UPI001C38FD3F|nr:serum response factor homolog A-like [Ixodes scapularis]
MNMLKIGYFTDAALKPKPGEKNSDSSSKPKNSTINMFLNSRRRPKSLEYAKYDSNKYSRRKLENWTAQQEQRSQQQQQQHPEEKFSTAAAAPARTTSLDTGVASPKQQHPQQQQLQPKQQQETQLLKLHIPPTSSLKATICNPK